MRANNVDDSASTPIQVGAEILMASMRVAKFEWNTSVSESHHYERMAAMDLLRKSLDSALPPKVD